MHRLCAIQKRQTLLRFERDGLETGFSQCGGTAHSLTLIDCLAFSDQRQGKVSQWCEISAGADRAFLRNHRMDAAIEHFHEQLDHFQPDAAETESEHIRTQQHHGARFGLGKGSADATGMAPNEI